MFKDETTNEEKLEHECRFWSSSRRREDSCLICGLPLEEFTKLYDKEKKRRNK